MKPGLFAEHPVLDSVSTFRVPNPVAPPRLLVELEPRRTVFFRNLLDLVRPEPESLELSSAPGDFWPDVFVVRRPARRRFAESLAYHALIVSIIIGVSHFWPQPTTIVSKAKFSSSDVIRYEPSEYLPPINTGAPKIPRAQKGEPEHARQEIISVPAESDNRTQTIVAPPKLKLNQDVPLPNIVAASPSTMPVPAAVSVPPIADLKMPALQVPVIAPPPVLESSNSKQSMHMTPGDVVAPQPTLNDSSVRNLGGMNIAHSEVVAPAPRLAVAEQRLPASGKPSLGNATVVPPSPSIEVGAASRSGGNLIALGIHPAPPNTTIEAPAGNRRGTFAATPEGKSGAPGTPTSAAGQDQSSTGSGQPQSGLPSGLVVGAGPKPATNTRLTADATPPRVSSVPHAAETSKNAPTDVEKQVFGDRKFYSMTLNMPNLNSAGGSWVIHFAELKGNAEKGDLSTPVPTHEVDPGYPIELMRQNVHGTVTLYAVIHSDGSVGEVRVLRGIDDTLDQYARTALLRWKFQPATKNGSAIDLEAVVMIPFRPTRARSGF